MVVEQPNGKFARFSDIMNGFSHINMTLDDYAIYLVESDKEDKVMKALFERGLEDDVKKYFTGKPVSDEGTEVIRQINEKSLNNLQDAIKETKKDLQAGRYPSCDFDEALRSCNFDATRDLDGFYYCILRMCDPNGSVEKTDEWKNTEIGRKFFEDFKKFLKKVDQDTLEYARKNGRIFNGNLCLPIEIFTKLEMLSKYGKEMYKKAFSNWSKEDTFGVMVQDYVAKKDCEGEDYEDDEIYMVYNCGGTIEQVADAWRKLANYGVIYGEDGIPSCVLNLELLKEQEHIRPSDVFLHALENLDDEPIPDVRQMNVTRSDEMIQD